MTWHFHFNSDFNEMQNRGKLFFHYCQGASCIVLFCEYIRVQLIYEIVNLMKFHLVFTSNNQALRTCSYGLCVCLSFECYVHCNPIKVFSVIHLAKFWVHAMIWKVVSNIWQASHMSHGKNFNYFVEVSSTSENKENKHN